jgi:5-bromo-4-chloroindolyl phosphate hydrolysis protein
MPIPFRKLKKSGLGIGPLLLYILPLPLLVVIVHSLTTGRFLQLVLSLCSLGGIWLSAWFLKQAHYYEWESKRRKWNRSSRFPWRFAAATLTGICVFVITYTLVEHNIFISVLTGMLASAGVILRYGFDPQYDSDKDTSLFGVTTEELVEILDEAENNLNEINRAAKTIKNRELKGRLLRIAAKTRDILTLIEQDPKDLRRARKFLKVYLHGARAVSSQYASSPHASDNQELEQNFRNVLDTIENVIEEQKLKLQENDILDLDVKIEVLEAQLKHEGVI